MVPANLCKPKSTIQAYAHDILTRNWYQFLVRVMQSGTSFCLVTDSGTRQNLFYSALESGNHVIVIVTSDWSLLLCAFC